ncbi:MAG: glycosyltransferase [Clostridiales bacterium]|nr:glycosyltransferase [Clostridiales bacterium]
MVCFLILHYIATEETTLCVDSILNNVKGDLRVVVVDNNSPNNSFQVLHDIYNENDRVDVIKLEKNEGFARGNNYGYSYAIKKYSPQFIVAMNNDMEITQDDFIDHIEKRFNDYHYFVMGPDIYSTKKKYHQNPQTRKLPTRKELEQRYRKLWLRNQFKFLIKAKWMLRDLRKNKQQNTETASQKNRIYVDHVVEDVMLHGSCYVFSPLFIENHPKECFYNKTFMYMEAEILYYQCSRDNEKMIYYPWLHVDHHEDVSTDAEYKKQYEKSVFSVKCLLTSTRAFIELMDKDGYR